ncbi:MAG: acyloxyacyl hydrolase, partial [Saprospiraceae bacterium]|nr:acyloxyacyl hydrolase [Saprospiraceae bacterium]
VGYNSYLPKFLTITLQKIKRASHSACILLLACWAYTLPAQKISLDASIYQGSVWRHSPKLTTQSGEHIGGQEIGFRIHTTGKYDWQAWQHYPAFGLSLGHFRLGEGSHNEAFALLPHLSIYLLRAGPWSAQFRVGTGLAWVTKPYDWFSNSGQNALGSHWNNITQFRLGAEFRATPRLRFNAGGSMTHFSNGGSALPNFGVNVFSGWAGAAWFFQPLKNEDLQPAKTSMRAVSRRFGGQIQSGLALLEIAALDGPKHAVWITSAAGYFQINRINRVLLGMDHESNRAIYEWGLHSARFSDEAAARQGSTRLTVFAAEEFLFGELSIVLQAGKYVGNNINQYVPKASYAKLSARYYLPGLFGSDLKPFAGISIKAHKFTAEYISGNVGLSF